MAAQSVGSAYEASEGAGSYAPTGIAFAGICEEARFCPIARVLAGSPAEKIGLRAGDFVRFEFQTA